MKVKILFGIPDSHFSKLKIFKRIKEHETCFNTIIGYKNWYPTKAYWLSKKEKDHSRLRWISVCLYFIGFKIYY